MNQHYDLGFDCALIEGSGFEDNPYHESHAEHWEWEMGYLDGLVYIFSAWGLCAE